MKRFVFLLAMIGAAAGAEATEAVGDTLTVIQRPLPGLPAIVADGDTVVVSCSAAPGTVDWQVELRRGHFTVPLPLAGAAYDATTLWWTLRAVVPPVPVHELYDLRVTAAGGLDDVARHAVQVLAEIPQNYDFIHLTDLHLPDHRFSSSGGVPADSTEMADLRAVIADVNLINPAFVVITGDIVNEGELEDYLGWRSYTRAQRVLGEFEVPVYLVAGNHDLGGWDSTPPPDGTARRNWWRFFGWPRLNAPPAGAPWRTQDYSFDLGQVHYAALEAYDNYDNWRWSIYGDNSFLAGQLQWLAADLAAAAPRTGAQVLFHHYDFAGQLDLAALGLEMALWGHIHQDQGNVLQVPYDLATSAVCDGARSYRIVRVSGATLTPRPTRDTGTNDNNLSVEYTPANDGTANVVTALVRNHLSEHLAYTRLRVVMPAGGTYGVDGGDLVQVDESGPLPVVQVGLDLPAYGSRIVTVTRQIVGVEGALPAVSEGLQPPRPNPFNPGTSLAYQLAAPARVQLRVFDARGRLVRVLVSGDVVAAGLHAVPWDGRDGQGRASPAGVYLARLDADGQSWSQRLTLVE